MKWQLLHWKNTSCLFSVMYFVAETTFSGSPFFFWLADAKQLLPCEIPFTQSITVMMLRLRAVIEKSNRFAEACLQPNPRSTMKSVQQGNKDCIFAPLPALIRTPRAQLHWQLYLHFKCVAEIPKWEPKLFQVEVVTSVRQLLSTETLNTWKVNLRAMHFYCITHKWRRFDEWSCVESRLSLSTDMVLWLAENAKCAFYLHHRLLSDLFFLIYSPQPVGYITFSVAQSMVLSAAALWYTGKVSKVISGDCDTCNSFTRWHSRHSTAGNVSWLQFGLFLLWTGTRIIRNPKTQTSGFGGSLYSCCCLPIYLHTHCVALQHLCAQIGRCCGPLRSDTQSGYSVKDWTLCVTVSVQWIKYDLGGWGDSYSFYYIIICLSSDAYTFHY